MILQSFLIVGGYFSSYHITSGRQSACMVKLGPTKSCDCEQGRWEGAKGAKGGKEGRFPPAPNLRGAKKSYEVFATML